MLDGESHINLRQALFETDKLLDYCFHQLEIAGENPDDRLKMQSHISLKNCMPYILNAHRLKLTIDKSPSKIYNPSDIRNSYFTLKRN